MITIEIPGHGTLNLSYLVMDYNGTLAIDGLLIEGVAERLVKLADLLEIHVITADTFGLARDQLKNLPVTIRIAAKENQAQQKLDYINTLGAEQTVAIGNGKNDWLMLQHAQLGIATLQTEGAALKTLTVADVVVLNINDALDLLTNKKRLIATLRQ